jgi:C4-dicarboxylate-specific signal transduction histidine kinase
VARDAPLTRDTFLAAIHSEDRETAISSLREVWRADQPAVRDIRVALADGRARWVRIRSRSHPDEHGDPNQLSGIFIDVTDQKAAEAEADLQRMELAHLMRVSVLGELSGAIAHELNQPLTAILANAQAARLLLAEKSPDLGIITEVLDDIVQEDNRAGEVIHRLRGLLRKGESKYGPVDINDLVQSTLRLLHSELIARGIRVDLALADRLPLASGDAVQLQQVLLNLVMNATDAMSSTVPPRRLITIRTQPGTDGHIAAIVADRGRGIAAVAKDRLFQPFFTTKDHGLGLGLSICATIVKSHGGTLSLDDNADGGATAMLTLPGVAEMATAS